MDTLIGAFGVSLLLVAFVLQLTKKITAQSLIYLWLNFFGAAIAGYASYRIDYWPFVILEGFWAGVALVAILSGKESS